jgi:DNA-binding MurR/RpiR family transcriptional regulator
MRPTGTATGKGRRTIDPANAEKTGLGELTARVEKLTQADTRLLDVLLADPVRAAMEHGKEIAARAGVHPSAAVRLAQRLGFTGYPQLREYLRSRLVEDDYETPEARIAARLARADDERLLDSVLTSEITALEHLRSTVSDADIRRFSVAILKARRIFLFGHGHGAALAELVALRLRRSGYDARDLSETDQQLAEHLALIASDDVLWTISFRQVSPRLKALRRIAAGRGACLLALTDLRGARLDPPSHAQIAVSRGGPGESQSLVVPMTIANTVVLDLARIDDGRSMRALSNYRELRQRL